MYSLLHLHLHELFGDDYSQTKLSQSFDEAKDVFRFDLKPEGMIPYSTHLLHVLVSNSVLLVFLSDRYFFQFL